MAKTDTPAPQAPVAGVAPNPNRKQAPSLDPSRITLAEFKRAEWVATCEPGTVPEDLADPLYWAHKAADLKPFDQIWVRAADGTWLADCLVLDSSRAWCKVKILHLHSLTDYDVSLTQTMAMEAMPYEIVHRGPEEQWSVIRKADRALVHSKEATHDGARAWMLERLKAG